MYIYIYIYIHGVNTNGVTAKLSILCICFPPLCQTILLMTRTSARPHSTNKAKGYYYCYNCYYC